MPKTPIQTLVDTSQDPGLSYLTGQDAVASSGARRVVSTDSGNVFTQYIPVNQFVYNIVETTNQISGASGESGDLQFNQGGQIFSDSDLRYDPNTDSLNVKTIIVNNHSDLGPVSSIRITGGVSGQALTTDGLGNLTWAAVSTAGLASTTYVDSAISNLINAAPTALDTLNELAAALGDDANFATTVTNALTDKVSTIDFTWDNLGNKPTIGSGFDGTQVIQISNTASSNTSTEGALTVAGGVGIEGNINVGGHKHIFNGNIHATGLDSRTMYIGSYADDAALTAPTLIMKNSYQTYVQSALINSSQYGSADWVAYGDQGTENDGWADFGYTSHNFTDINYTVTGSGDGYFFVKGQTGFDGQGGNLVLATGGTGTTNDIVFATGGFLHTDEFARISHSNNSFELHNTGASITFADGTIQTTAYNGAAVGTGNLTIADTTINSNTDVIISAGQTASPAPGFYKFASDGSFEFPNYVKQITNGSVSCLPNQDTVIYTGTTQWQHTFKLLLKIEGTEDGQTGWDTQSCEMVIAKSFRNDTVVGSVYGLVYTSTNPLATFTTRWNATSSRVEVLCRPTSTTNTVVVRSFVTEMTTSD